MGFVVLPALVTDISAAYDAYFAAFKDNAVTRAFFSSATVEDLTNSQSEFRYVSSVVESLAGVVKLIAHTAHVFQYWQNSATQYTLKCVDTETGAVVGMALWDCYLTPSDWRRPEISWLQGQEKERAEALVRPLWDAREKLWLDQKYLYCHVIAVHPNFQRRGIGELLFKFGADIAQQTRLPIYIESSREAERLYEKMDCKRLKEKPVHKSEDLWPDKGEPAREDQDVALFVWIPEYGESNVPRTVELAQ